MLVQKYWYVLENICVKLAEIISVILQHGSRYQFSILSL